MNLINDGLITSEESVTIQFAGVGSMTRYVCILDSTVVNEGCKME